MHKECHAGNLATSVRKANFVVKFVVLECYEKTVCLVPEVTDEATTNYYLGGGKMM